jgi:hypothetical protein
MTMFDAFNNYLVSWYPLSTEHSTYNWLYLTTSNINDLFTSKLTKPGQFTMINRIAQWIIQWEPYVNVLNYHPNLSLEKRVLKGYTIRNNTLNSNYKALLIDNRVLPLETRVNDTTEQCTIENVNKPT